MVSDDAGITITPDAGTSDVRITETVASTRFVTREHFIAAGEMQISGEPFAEAMGRDLTGYSRDHLPTDVYFDPSPLSAGPWIDLAGFSTAVESYEYSKQPMNSVGLESGAGTALAFGPLIDVGDPTGSSATVRLANRIQQFARGSNALGKWVFVPGTYPVNDGGGNLNAAGTGLPALNPLGWPGLWPITHPFRSFDPTVDPTHDESLGCSISSDDDPGAAGALSSADYECDASSLHLRDHASQVESVVSPGSDGFATWKFGLWCINYLQVMHDSTEAAVSSVNDPDGGVLASVGAAGNSVVGVDDQGNATAPGTFLGSSDIEGFQAQVFIEAADNRAQDWLFSLSTSDGVTLSGFPSVLAAESYADDSPLRWFPRALAVAEQNGTDAEFDRPTFALASADSELLDQVGLAMGYAEFYALTDASSVDVGGAQPALAFFDGDPFAADDPRVDGEHTLHDRALAMMRVSLVNLDRLHVDPASGLLVDHAAMNGTSVSRGTTISTTSVAYTILGLRTVLRALSSQLELYSNNTPDSDIASTPLDTFPINFPGQPKLSFTGRLSQIQRAEGELLYSHLTDETGRAWDGWDVSANAPLDSQDTLDAHTAAVRGLFAMYLATGKVKYRERALAVFARLESVFYDADARLYSPTPAPVSDAEFTPLRFALLQSTLRDVYELVASRPGNEALAADVEDRVARLDKLVLNGWDDRNRNRIVDWPDECVNVVGGIPRGALQMAERTLTGETGSLQDALGPGQIRIPTFDREHDCVPEIDDAHLPASLADEVVFHVQR